jgi:hypothetical protein
VNYIQLTHQYRLYAFPDYWSMRKVRDALQSEYKTVVLAKEFSEVKSIEANHYLETFHSRDSNSYRNYLREGRQDLQPSGLLSLKTALQVLYKHNEYSAKYILIERV